MRDSADSATPILVTGAGGAIGGAVAAELCSDHRPVVLWTRERVRGEEVRARLVDRFPDARVELVEGDIGCLATVGTTSAQMASSYPHLGAIIHAAGVLTRHREETSEGLERMFATNYLGPFHLTGELLRRLDSRHPLRVLTITPPSTTPVNFDDLLGRRSFRPLRAFAASKTASLLFAYALARKLGRGPRTSNAFFPGVVRSGLMREAPFLVREFRPSGRVTGRSGGRVPGVACYRPTPLVGNRCLLRGNPGRVDVRVYPGHLGPGPAVVGKRAPRLRDARPRGRDGTGAGPNDLSVVSEDLLRVSRENRGRVPTVAFGKLLTRPRARALGDRRWIGMARS